MINSRYIASIICLAAAFSLAEVAKAGDWTIVPQLNVEQEYTDNVTLVGQNTLQDYITTFNTGLSVRGESSRLQSNVDYNLQYQIYDSEDDFSGINHQLQGNSSLTLIDQFLYFDALSNVSQQDVGNQNQNFAFSNRSQPGDQATVVYSQFRPIVRRHFGRWADFEGSYGRGTTSTSGGESNDTGNGNDDLINLRLSSGRVLSRTPITLTYTENETDYDSGNKNKQQRFTTEISYIINRKLRLSGTVGTEDNTSSSGNSNRNGTTWSMGGTWTPSSRTSLSGDVGDRVFGNVYNVSARHQRRRWVFTADYREEFTTRNQELRDLVLVPQDDAFGDPIFDPTANSNIGTPEDLASIEESAFVSKNLGIGLTYRGLRSNFSFRYYNTQRTSQEGNGGDTTTRGWRMSADRRLSRKFTLRLTADFRKALTNSSLDNKLFLISPSMSYRLGPHTDVSCSYTYQDGGGPDINNNFLENALSASMTVFY